MNALDIHDLHNLKMLAVSDLDRAKWALEQEMYFHAAIYANQAALWTSKALKASEEIKSHEPSANQTPGA